MIRLHACQLKEVIEVVLVHDFHQTLKCLASVGTVGSIPSVIRRLRVREGRASRVTGLLEKCVVFRLGGQNNG